MNIEFCLLFLTLGLGFGSAENDEWEIKIGYNWLDQDGNATTLKSVFGISNHNDCKKECTSTLKCIGYSFIGKDYRPFIGLYNYCNLKSESQTVKLNRVRVSVVSGKIKPESNLIRHERSIEKKQALGELLDELFKYRSEFEFLKGSNLDEFHANAIEYFAGQFDKANSDNDSTLSGKELNTHYGAGFFNLNRKCPRSDIYILFAFRLVSKVTNSFHYPKVDCLKSINRIREEYGGVKPPPRRTNLGITLPLKSKNKITLSWPKARGVY